MDVTPVVVATSAGSEPTGSGRPGSVSAADWSSARAPSCAASNSMAASSGSETTAARVAGTPVRRCPRRARRASTPRRPAARPRRQARAAGGRLQPPPGGRPGGRSAAGTGVDSTRPPGPGVLNLWSPRPERPCPVLPQALPSRRPPPRLPASHLTPPLPTAPGWTTADAAPHWRTKIRPARQRPLPHRTWLMRPTSPPQDRCQSHRRRRPLLRPHCHPRLHWSPDRQAQLHPTSHPR